MKVTRFPFLCTVAISFGIDYTDSEIMWLHGLINIICIGDGKSIFIYGRYGTLVGESESKREVKVFCKSERHVGDDGGSMKKPKRNIQVVLSSKHD